MPAKAATIAPTKEPERVAAVPSLMISGVEEVVGVEDAPPVLPEP